MTPHLRAALRCPRCRCPLQDAAQEGERLLRCSSSECEYFTSGFPILGDTPVLIDFDRSVLDRHWIMSTGAASTKRRSASLLTTLAGWLTVAPGPTERNAREFIARVKSRSASPAVLVIGGGVVGAGAASLYEDPAVTIVGTDIYRSDLTDLVADGHQLPFADGSFDGVWIQAVLEHVLEPHVVAGEIHRVIADGGYVYGETPFMQQVHEGAFDFTRFTPSGHRWLFGGFEEVSSGVTRGPATVLIWSIRYFVAGLFRSYRLGNIAAALFFWLAHLDRFVDARFAADGPSAIFFLGRRVGRHLRPREIVSAYRGAL